MSAAIGIIGGSGLYEIEGFEKTEERKIDTPFGEPSDALVGGTMHGRRVWFLPRHGRGHRILPHEINHRANIWAMKSLEVKFLVCVTAVGSLQETYAPRSVVIPNQYFDRTSRRHEHTFFGRGIAAHIAFADPVSTPLSDLVEQALKASGATVHRGGTYVNMDGPAFSTRAESHANRQLGFDVIGMTNLAEAKLAREAEISLATMAMVTDYDCWKVDEEAVHAAAVIEHLMANVALAKETLQKLIPMVPADADWPEHHALDGAIMTSPDLWPPETVDDLHPILARYRKKIEA